MRMTLNRLALGCALSVCGCFYNPTGSVGVDGDGGSEASSEGTVCGDGAVEGAEECDDGNQDGTDSCTNACKLAVCGDGVLASGEECDEGRETPTCDVDCTPVVCGDGVLNASAGEGCDDGSGTATCDDDCSLAQCGDGTLNPDAGEACDDGNQSGGDHCSLVCASTAVVDVSVGDRHMCVAFDSGAVRCWGDNSYGQLGQGNSVTLGDQPGELPTDDIGAGGAVVQVALGDLHTCARMDTGGVRCWGAGERGQLGHGTFATLGTAADELPAPEVALGGAASQIAAGERHTCAIVADGVRCWGSNSYGQLGNETTVDLAAPTGASIKGISDVKQIVAGTFHTCALSFSGFVRCWGYNNSGQLGLGSTEAIGDDPGEMPPPALTVSGAGDMVVSLAAGAAHTCALLESGAVRCWGANGSSQLGGVSGTIGDGPGEMPPEDVNLGLSAVRVVAGEQHSCALLTNKRVKCWGRSPATGYPGLGDVDTAEPPMDVNLGGDVLMLASGRGRFTCALLTDNTLRCWGDNDAGQLGYGHTEQIGDDETPASAGPVPF